MNSKTTWGGFFMEEEKEKLYSIGEVSKLMNISIKALRYYDKIGLFKPAYVDPNSNYRYYSDFQLYRLDLIKSLSYIGTPLNQIKEVEELNNDDYISFLIHQEQVVKEKIDYLYEIQQIISSVRRDIQRQEAPFGEVVLLEKEEIKIIQKRVRGLGPKNTFNSSFSSFRKYGPSTEGFRKKGYGSIFPIKEYKSIDDINYDYLFTPLLSNKKMMHLERDTELAILPKGKYLSIICHSTTFDDYFQSLQKLIHFIHTNEVKVMSDIYEFFSINYQSDEHKYINEFRVLIEE